MVLIFVCSIPYTKIKSTKILTYEIFFLVSATFDLHHTQSLAQLQVLTMSRYRFFAKASNSSPMAAVQI